MRAWPSPRWGTEILDRFGSAPEVRLFDARTGQVEETRPDHGTARMYVCGITPYDATHMGHANTYVTFDLLNRAWRAAGHDVHYVQNVTDIDDPLLERANATGEDWQALAERETQLFRDDMTALGVIPPAEYLGAVESIDLVIALIQRLQEQDAVYDVDGDLYFSVTADPRFGEVSGLSREQMLKIFAERGGDPDRAGKRDALDCLLWLLERPGEPAWESPFGRGRPGWHIECSAIAHDNLGNDFDIQGGGSDLVFPHHEMSAGEAQVAYPGHSFAKAYAHGGMVGYDGEKMSKSKGNLVLVSELRRNGVDPRAIRLVLLSHHYRDDWEWFDDGLIVAQARLKTWEDAVRSGGPDAEPTVREVLARMADDLDAPGALSAIDDWVDSSGEPKVEGSGALIAALAESSLGISLSR